MLKTQELTLNVGPQHPATHGVFRVILTLDGENVVDAKPVVGYLHRGIEKLAEGGTYLQALPLTDRLDYVSAMCNNLAYVQTVEKLLEVEVPERAEYIRVIMAELSRIASHLIFTGTFSLDLGAFTPLLYCFRTRELILDLFEAVSGQRMTFSYIRFGGVAKDLPDGFEEKCREALGMVRKNIDDLNTILTGNEIFQARCRGVGVLDPELAVEYGVTGPILRASGVRYDVRKDDPYGIYDRFDFEVPTGTNGDTLDRYLVRVAEMGQSARIIEQALDQLPKGEVAAKVPRNVKPVVGEAYHHIEGPRGDLGFFVVSDGSPKPYRWRVRSPAFVNISVLPELVRGLKVADLVAILASLDPVLGEIDR